MQHLVLAVVKAQAVPCRMFVTIARIEELVGVAGQVAQPFNLVFHGMRMNDVHDDGYAVAMCGVN